MKGDHVHIALGHDHRLVLGHGLARAIEAVEICALVEQRRLGRVEIFRLARAHHPAAEGDHPATPVVDREHHAAAEAVIGLTLVLGLDREACFNDLVQRHLLALQGR